MRINAPKGTQDILPEAAVIWQWIEENVRQVFFSYGFGEIRTPIFEQTQLFARGIGETTDIVEKEMYTFLDKGGRSMTLRPEGTASVVRSYLEHNLASRAGVTKLHYFGPMFRQEKPQAGRYRQFNQFGAEVLGEDSPLVDAEIIALATDIYRRMGLDNLEVRINSVGCTVCRSKFKEAIVEYLSPKSEELCESCRKRLEKNPLRILDCKSPVCKGLTDLAPGLEHFLCDECNSHFTDVKSLLDCLDLHYEVDSRLVRGLDYYTKTVFEVIYKDLGAQNAVCGGGRYDGLVQEVGGPPTPGIGFAAGVERLILTLEKQGKLPRINWGPQVYVSVLGESPQGTAFKLAQELRKRGIRTEMEMSSRSLKAQMKTADKLQVQLVIILGENEIARDIVLIRRMSDGEQRELALSEAVDVIQEELTGLY